MNQREELWARVYELGLSLHYDSCCSVDKATEMATAAVKAFDSKFGTRKGQGPGYSGQCYSCKACLLCPCETVIGSADCLSHQGKAEQAEQAERVPLSPKLPSFQGKHIEGCSACPAFNLCHHRYGSIVCIDGLRAVEAHCKP
jgi:hypothetical protein